MLLAAALLALPPTLPVRLHDDHDQAIPAVTPPIAAAPADVELLAQRSDLLRRRGDHDLALADLAAADGAAFRDLVRARVLADLGLHASALAELDLHLARRPDDGEALVLQAAWREARGDLAGARASYDGALVRLDPPRTELVLARAALEAHAPARELAVLDAGLARLGPVPALRARRAALAASGATPAADLALPWRAPRARPAAHTPSLGGPTTLVAPDAVWKYLDDGTDQGTAWRAPTFPDGGWASGPAELGYGDNDEATVVGFGPDAANKYVTTYFRHAFTVTDPAATPALELHLTIDDGAVAYLNGVEVARRNMPSGTITYTTLAASTISGEEEHQVFVFPVVAALLVPGTNVLAVEVHQRDVDSSDITFIGSLVGTDELAVNRGPYLQRMTDDEVTVRWRTNLPAPTYVEWGLAPGPATSSSLDPTPTTVHEVRLTGLSADTLYEYAVGDGAGLAVGGDAQHRFRTAPPAGTDLAFRAWILGDSGTGDSNAAAVRDAYQAFTGATATDLLLMLGDNAYNSGTEAEYQLAVFDMYADTLRATPLFPTRGNHEKVPGTYYDLFTMPATGEGGGVPSGTEAYYAFDWGNVHFVCLDSYGSSLAPGGPMATWLQADLAANDQDWTVAFWHHPPYTKGSHDSDTESLLVEMRQTFVPLLEAGGVDLVLSGHSHSYERSFLIDGHHGLSGSWSPALHRKDAGTGNPGTDGPFVKATVPNAGAVFAVAGSSGKLSSGDLNHPAHFVETMTLGSLVLDVDGERMDVRFVTDTGAVHDWFALRTHPVDGLVGDTTTLSVSSGGTQAFDLDVGAGFAGDLYFLLGSLSGSAPGLPVDGQVLPLNFDLYTGYTLANPNTAVHQTTFGVLGPAGTAQAAFAMPPGQSPSLVGQTALHAFAVLDGLTTDVTRTSGAFPVSFLP